MSRQILPHLTHCNLLMGFPSSGCFSCTCSCNSFSSRYILRQCLHLKVSLYKITNNFIKLISVFLYSIKSDLLFYNRNADNTNIFPNYICIYIKVYHKQISHKCKLLSIINMYMYYFCTIHVFMFN